jgi:hypothetical protein
MAFLKTPANLCTLPRKAFCRAPIHLGTPAYSSQTALEKTLNTISRGFRGNQ